MTRVEYDALRMKFFLWAREQGLSVGNDESGYNDDEPKAAAIWKQWLAESAPAPTLKEPTP